MLRYCLHRGSKITGIALNPKQPQTGTKPLIKRTKIIETKRQNNETKQRNEKAEKNVTQAQRRPWARAGCMLLVRSTQRPKLLN